MKHWKLTSDLDLHQTRILNLPMRGEVTSWGLQACHAGWPSTGVWTAEERQTTGQKGGEA